MNSGFLRLEEVDKIFIQGKELEVVGVKAIDLAVAGGESVVLSGPSGSGKTTLLNMIGCLDKVTRGAIYLDDMELTALPEKRLSVIRRDHIGFVFQAYNLIPVLTARENIEYVMRLRAVSQRDCRARSLEVAKRLDIDTLLDKLPHQMSGGQQQRVAVARAVAAKPKLILADEPTANLDSVTSENLIDMMQDLNRDEGVTIIFASHDPMVINKARRSVVMKDGRIVHDTAGCNGRQ